MPAIIEVKYFNAFILRKTYNAGGVPTWGGSRGDNTYPQAGLQFNTKSWFVEEARIKGGFNNTSVSFGTKAYLVEEEPQASKRINALIYSGIFNSRTGINNTNQFPADTDISKAVDPANGSIQKLYAEDTNLIIFQENKISRALIDKDAIYSAEGGGSVTSSNLVIGQIVPYAGNFGISKNPESFAVYGFRKYFVDKNRNAVLRLSQDGLTEISNYGMKDFFRDQLTALDTGNVDTVGVKPGKIIGGWDTYTKQYVVSMQPNVNNEIQSEYDNYKTLSFDEDVRGWTSFFNYKPSFMFSLKGRFYTTPVDSSNVNSGVYLHNAPDIDIDSPRANFYNRQYKASIRFIFNPKVSLSKNFKTINYEGNNGWQVDSFVTDITGLGSPNIGQSDYTTSESQDTTAVVFSYNEGAYDTYGNQAPSQLTPPILHAGFNRKENKYMANLISTSGPAYGEVLFNGAMTGVKGHFAEVTMSTDSTTDPGKMKELFAVSSEYVDSAY